MPLLLQKTIKEYPVYITSIGFVFLSLCIYPQQVSSISCWGFLRLKNNSIIFSKNNVLKNFDIFMFIHNTK